MDKRNFLSEGESTMATKKAAKTLTEAEAIKTFMATKEREQRSQRAKEAHQRKQRAKTAKKFIELEMKDVDGCTLRVRKKELRSLCEQAQKETLSPTSSYKLFPCCPTYPKEFFQKGNNIMAISCVYSALATVTETLTFDGIDDRKNFVVYSDFNTTETIDADTDVPATVVYADEIALVDGAATIDLTALTAAPFGAKSMSGLKVQVLKVIAKDTNANPVTVTFGAANPYELLGAAFSFDVKAGQEVTIYGNDLTPDVSGTAKNIDLAGTGSQSVKVIIVAG